MTEADLLRKLVAIDALLTGATSDGEAAAARAARERIAARLNQLPPREQEYCFSIHSAWGRKLFTALAKKLGIEPFRYRGQRRTTRVIRATDAQMNLLWKQFVDAEQILNRYLDEVTDRVITQSLGTATDDVVEKPEQQALPLSS